MLKIIILIGTLIGTLILILIFFKIKKYLLGNQSGNKFCNQLNDTHKKIKKGVKGLNRLLGDLYYSGSEIHGIQSNPHLAIKWYKRAVEEDGDLMSLLYIGDIYKHGIHNEITPNPKYAWKCYQQVANHTHPAQGPESIFNLAQERQQDMIINPIEPEVIVHTGFNPVIENTIENTVVIPKRVITLAPIEIRNDPQNAHDTTLLRGARETITKLQKSTPITIDIPTMLPLLRKKIESTPRAKEAISVLDKIELNDIPMTNMHDLKEVDILNIVYNRIHSPINAERQNNLMDALIGQLCDGYGPSGPVCATGRATRILSALDAIDVESDTLVTLKPKWAVKQELLNNASVIRDRLFKEKGDEFEKIFNKSDPTPDEEKMANEFTDNFKKILRDEFKKNYVDSGILTQTDLDSELDKWIDSI